MGQGTDELRDRLAAISEELADAAMDRIRASLDAAGDDALSTELANEEKRITRARRAVDKAVHLLG